jgi:hypothetical protein
MLPNFGMTMTMTIITDSHVMCHVTKPIFRNLPISHADSSADPSDFRFRFSGLVDFLRSNHDGLSVLRTLRLIIVQYDGHLLQQISVQLASGFRLLASGVGYLDVKMEQGSVPNNVIKPVLPSSPKKWIEVHGATQGDLRAN